MIVDKLELAWAAGLFDGEGTAGLRWNGKAGDKRAPRRIGAALGMVTTDVVDRFAKAIGFGKTYYGLRQSKYPNAQLMTKWMAHSFEHVQALAALLWASLSAPKRQQFSRALVEYNAYPHRLRKGGGHRTVR